MTRDDIGRLFDVDGATYSATALLIDIASPAALDPAAWPYSIADRIAEDRSIDAAALLMYDDGASPQLQRIAAVHRAQGWSDLTGHPLTITAAD